MDGNRGGTESSERDCYALGWWKGWALDPILYARLLLMFWWNTNQSISLSLSLSLSLSHLVFTKPLFSFIPCILFSPTVITLVFMDSLFSFCWYSPTVELNYLSHGAPFHYVFYKNYDRFSFKLPVIIWLQTTPWIWI